MAKTTGYVETLTGRRRYLSKLTSVSGNEVKHAERQAVNTTIQGTAADIAKKAILQMNQSLMRYAEKLNINSENPVKLVLHLHDELLYEVPYDIVKQCAKLLKHSMENCVKLSVPLTVKLKSGQTWGELDEIDVIQL